MKNSQTAVAIGDVAVPKSDAPFTGSGRAAGSRR